MNDIIKKTNQKLNSSDSKRFENWKNYRQKITDFIIQNLDKNSYKNCLIVGAGNCDDLDLGKIVKRVNAITLLDIDKNAMENAVLKYNLGSEIVLFENDLTGLNLLKEWNDFVSIILSLNSKNQIDEVLKKIENAIKGIKVDLSQKYEIIIISPIYTQLLLPQVVNFLKILKELKYDKSLYLYIEEKLLNLVSLSIECFNENILNLLEIDGEIFIMSDIFETTFNSDFYMEIKSLKTTSDLNNYQKNYQDKYGYGAGDYGLEKLVENLKTTSCFWTEWPFNNVRNLFVKTIKAKR